MGVEEAGGDLPAPLPDAAGVVDADIDALRLCPLPTLVEGEVDGVREGVSDRVAVTPGEGASTFRALRPRSKRMSALLAADGWISQATVLVPRVSHCLAPPTGKYVCCWLALDTALMARELAVRAPEGRLLRPTSTPLMKHRMPSDGFTGFVVLVGKGTGRWEG